MASKHKKTQTSPMSWEEFQILISRLAYDIENKIDNPQKKIQHSRFLLLIALGCYTGLRIGDLLSVQWGDVYNKESLHIIEKKTGKDRSITLNENLRKIIKRYYKEIKPVTLNEAIFLNMDGKVFSTQYVNKKLKAILSTYKIKVRNASSHTLRKTFARRVFEHNNRSEEALITLSHIFNHSNVAVTRRYIGLDGKFIENVYLGL